MYSIIGQILLLLHHREVRAERSAREQLLAGIQCPAHGYFSRLDVCFDPAVPAEEHSLLTLLINPAAGIPIVSHPNLTKPSPVLDEIGRALAGMTYLPINRDISLRILRGKAKTKIPPQEQDNNIHKHI